MSEYLNEQRTLFTSQIFGETHNAFVTYTLFEITEKVIGGCFYNSKKKQERLIAKFHYHPRVNNEIEVRINASDFTESFKEKLLKIEEYCQKKIAFEVNVQEGK